MLNLKKFFVFLSMLLVSSLAFISCQFQEDDLNGIWINSLNCGYQVSGSTIYYDENYDSLFFEKLYAGHITDRQTHNVEIDGKKHTYYSFIFETNNNYHLKDKRHYYKRLDYYTLGMSFGTPPNSLDLNGNLGFTDKFDKKDL